MAPRTLEEIDEALNQLEREQEHMEEDLRRLCSLLTAMLRARYRAVSQDRAATREAAEELEKLGRQ